jgi:tetratricopeptide (TPR) repeat protein
MYEHWLYLPMFGFWLALFSLSFYVLESVKKESLRKWLFYVSMIFLIFSFSSFAFLTLRRNADWRDPITFYEKNLSYTPNSYIQRNNLAMAYADAGRHLEAIEQYRRSLSIADIYPQVHYNLGNSLAAVSLLDEAAAEYRQAIAISPEFFLSYVNLVAVLDSQGKRDEVEAVFSEGDGFFADIADFWYLKGVVYYKWQDYQAALSAMERVAALSPKDEAVKSVLKSIESKIGK